MIKKLNKSDYANLRSQRLIALLLTTSKLIEAVIASKIKRVAKE